MQSVTLNSLEGLAAQMLGGPLTPTQKEFIFAKERVCWYTGPVGTGKTAAVIASILLPAMMLPGSRWFIGRAVYWTLEETTQKKFVEACDRLGPDVIIDREVGPPYKIWLAPAVRNEDGTPAEPSEIILYSLDNIGKLKSMEFTGAAIDEANEVDQQMAATLNERLRLKLPSQERAVGPFFLRMSSNPVTRNHWLHKKFCGEEDCELPPWGRKFWASREENQHNLPPDYYEEISKGMTTDQRIRFIDGNCGPNPEGEGVFAKDFVSATHTAALKWDANRPGMRGWDFGRRRPACVWAQEQANGSIWRFAALLGDNETLQAFIRRVQQRTVQQFPDCKSWTEYVDPHGNQRKDNTEKTSIDTMREAGLHVHFRDVQVSTGLDLMGEDLNIMVQGKPKAMFDIAGCGILIEGYQGGYRWPVSKWGGVLREKPVADGFYEHVMDADRYIIVNKRMGSTPQNIERFKRAHRKVRNPLTGY